MAKKLKPFEKLLTIMISGKQVTLEEIEATLGDEIHMYRISTYIWHIKNFAKGVVKSIKDGRKVTAYQLVNVGEVKKYMSSEGIDVKNFVPGQAQKIVRSKKTKNTPVAPAATTSQKKVKKLADLKSSKVQEVISEDVEEIFDDGIESLGINVDVERVE